MKPKAFAVVKESIATDRASEAAGAAMRPGVYERSRKEGGLDMTAEEAARRAALVSLGKRSILFRFGTRAEEYEAAIAELVEIMASMELPIKPRQHPWVARAALQELTFDHCATCFGRGEVPATTERVEGRQPMRPCDACGGRKRKKYSEDGRISILAITGDMATKALRTLPAGKLRALLDAVGTAKSILVTAERIAVEGAGLMLERWGAEDVG